MRTEFNWAFADQLIVSAGNFTVGVLLTRILGLAGYGEYVFVWAASQFVFGIQNAVVIAPLQSARNSKFGVNALQLGLSSSALLGLLILAVVYSCGVWFFWSKSEFPRELLISGLTYCCALQVHEFIRRTLFLVESGSMVFLSDGLLYAFQLISIAWILPSAPSAPRALELVCLSYGAALICTAIVRRRFLGAVVLALPARTLGEIRSTTHLTGWLLGAAVLQWLCGNFLLVSAGPILGTAAMGAVRAAQNIVGVTHVLFQAVENAFPAWALREVRRSGEKHLATKSRLLAVVLGGATLIAGAASLLVADFVLDKLYGRVDPPALLALRWFVPIYALIAVCVPIRAALRTLGSTRPIFFSYVFAAVLTVFCGTYAVKHLGVTGVMVGMLLSQTLIAAVLVVGLQMVSRAKK